MAGRWGLLTNHAYVLIHIAEHPKSTLREIAASVGITDRAALSILRALEQDAIIARQKEGRRNSYTLDIEALMSHRSHGRYSVEQIASALMAIAGRMPGADVPPGMQLARSGAAAADSSYLTVGERLAE